LTLCKSDRIPKQKPVAGIPWLLWLVDHSLATSQRFDAAIRSLATPFGRLALLVLAWCYIFHSLAGLRHLALDLHSGIQLQPARRSAAIMLVLSIVLTAIVAVRLWSAAASCRSARTTGCATGCRSASRRS
jgi:succinate dehydrogenase cytochrome b556 subunit